MGTLFVALAAAGWGTWTLFLRGRGLPPSWQSVMILLVMAAVSLPLARRRAGRSVNAWLLLALLGAFDAGNYILYFGAIDRGPLAIAVLTHYLAPVLVALFAPLVLREPLGRRTPLALVASLGGLALLVMGGGGLSHEAVPAALLGGGSAFFYAANTLLSKKVLASFSVPEVIGWHALVAAGLIAALTHEPAPALRAFVWMPLAGALLLGAGGSALFYLGLRGIPAERAAVLTYLEPVVAAMVGALAFGEHLGASAACGAALILAGGVAVVTQRA